MSGNTAGTLLMAAAVIGTGGAALAALPAVAGAAAAGGAVSGALVAGSSTLATLGTVGTIGSQLFSGFQGQQAAEFERSQIEQQQRQEDVKASEDRAGRERKLSDILSSQRAIFGARGVSLSSGVATTAASASISEANRESSISALNTATAKSSLSRPTLLVRAPSYMSLWSPTTSQTFLDLRRRIRQELLPSMATTRLNCLRRGL